MARRSVVSITCICLITLAALAVLLVPSGPRSADAAVTHDDIPKRYRKKVASIKARLAEHAPESQFHIVVEPPFVIIGDEAPDKVRHRAVQTVRWSVALLEEALFERRPRRVIEVWLFAGKKSYRKHARLLFGDDPDTPYGYYSSRHDALIMNISTGGGTLVHEIVHPFVEADFPRCPAWLNEGLGSLYEAPSEREGRIVGRVNWRLPDLQRALRADEVPSFATLTSTTTEAFYERDPGTNYAQARYLLYYLQEHGLLGEYYRRFRKNVKRDPTGYKTLVAVLGAKDMDAFFERWKRYTVQLRYRSR